MVAPCSLFRAAVGLRSVLDCDELFDGVPDLTTQQQPEV